MKFAFLGNRRAMNGGRVSRWDKVKKKSFPTGRINIVITLPPDVIAALEVKPGDMLSIGQIVNLGYMPPKTSSVGLKKYNERRRIEKMLKSKE